MNLSEDLADSALVIIEWSVDRDVQKVSATIGKVLAEHGTPGLYGLAWIIAGVVAALAQPGEIDEFCRRQGDERVRAFVEARKTEDMPKAADVLAAEPEHLLTVVYGLAGLAGGLAAATLDADDMG